MRFGKAFERKSFRMKAGERKSIRVKKKNMSNLEQLRNAIMIRQSQFNKRTSNSSDEYDDSSGEEVSD